MSVFVVAGLSFDVKSKLVAECQARIARYSIGQALSDDDSAFFVDLVKKYHHDPIRKIGSGVARVYVSATDHGRRSVGLRIVRSDGSDIDFSWRQCITPKKSIDLFRAACREAVKEQISAFRKEVFGDTGTASCAICEKKLVIRDPSYDVDHTEVSFKEILDVFVASSAVDPDAMTYEDTGDLGTLKVMKDKRLEESWKAHHKALARLRLLCIPCHKKTRA